MSEFISDRKIKFALVGCGRISNNHFGSFEVLQEDCELVAVCDTDPVALETAVKHTGAKGYAVLFSSHPQYLFEHLLLIVLLVYELLQE